MQSVSTVNAISYLYLICTRSDRYKHHHHPPTINVPFVCTLASSPISVHLDQSALTNLSKLENSPVNCSRAVNPLQNTGSPDPNPPLQRCLSSFLPFNLLALQYHLDIARGRPTVCFFR